MRTTIELPDELLMKAKSHAALAGLSMKQFFILAIQQAIQPRKHRKSPPVINGPTDRRVAILTPEQIDEAMFG
ncbi:MAG: hypothetical protein HY820_40265 [Acidobacteria bacterium]|nr:hypothetical protein [Acidobacteriota bacterium]